MFGFLLSFLRTYKGNQGKLIQFPLVCVGYELFSRAVASQVSSPLQRLTSVFGMGTGGPTALKTLTQVLVPHFWLGTRTLFPIGNELWNLH